MKSKTNPGTKKKTPPVEKRIKVTVDERSVHVNGCRSLMNEPRAIWLAFDVREKNPEILCMGYSSTSQSSSALRLELMVYSRSVRGSDQKTTRIEITGLRGEWQMFTTTGRYYIYVTLVLPRQNYSETDLPIHREQEGA